MQFAFDKVVVCDSYYVCELAGLTFSIAIVEIGTIVPTSSIPIRAMSASSLM